MLSSFDEPVTRLVLCEGAGCNRAVAGNRRGRAAVQATFL
jgi:hypothetical protein